MTMTVTVMLWHPTPTLVRTLCPPVKSRSHQISPGLHNGGQGHVLQDQGRNELFLIVPNFLYGIFFYVLIFTM